MRYIISILLVLFLSGCSVYSQNPLTPFDKSDTMDNKLFGSWFWSEESERGYIHIGVDEKSGLLRVFMIEVKNDGELESMEFSGHPSTIGEKSYLNLKLLDPKESNAEGYVIVKYSATSDILKIGLMDNEAIIKAVESGRLKGRLEKERFFTSVHLSDTDKKIQKFVTRHDKVLFSEMKAFSKVNLSKLSRNN